MLSIYHNETTQTVIGCAIEVHRHLGPGMLESAYQKCLHYELINAGLNVKENVPIPLVYKSIHLDYGYRLDLLVDDWLVIELKSVECLAKVHTAQVLTYLRLGKFKLGLLINFNVIMLRNGIKRLVI